VSPWKRKGPTTERKIHAQALQRLAQERRARAVARERHVSLQRENNQAKIDIQSLTDELAQKEEEQKASECPVGDRVNNIIIFHIIIYNNEEGE
jgi:hypothetical protein